LAAARIPKLPSPAILIFLSVAAEGFGFSPETGPTDHLQGCGTLLNFA
jgi:hypothetical protein